MSRECGYPLSDLEITWVIEPRSFNDIARPFETGGAYYIDAEAPIDSPYNSSEGSTPRPFKCGMA